MEGIYIIIIFLIIIIIIIQSVHECVVCVCEYYIHSIKFKYHYDDNVPFEINLVSTLLNILNYKILFKQVWYFYFFMLNSFTCLFNYILNTSFEIIVFFF